MKMSRPTLILVILLAAIVAIILGLASMAREQPTTHVEVPVTNAATR